MGRKLHHSWNEDDFRVAGNILWRGTPDDDKFHGKSGDDTISGANGNDKLFGDKGNDSLYGQNDKDTLFGEKGYDLLDGGKGNDKLTGGSESDTFVFATKYDKDIVTDFEFGDVVYHDTIRLHLKGIESFEELAGHMEQVGKTVVITGGNGDVLTLKNVDIELFESYHFSFF
jgi:Ca2+-binding RTX toxin-like protein